MLDFLLVIPFMYMLIALAITSVILFAYRIRFFAVLALALAGLSFWHQTDIKPLELFAQYWWYGLVVGGLYFLFGSGWAIFKWDRLTKINKQNYAEAKERFLKQCKVNTLEELKPVQIKDYEELASKYQKLNVLDSKAQIMRWIMNWPDSLCYHLFFNLLKDILNGIINRLTGVFNQIALRNAKEYLDDQELIKSLKLNSNIK